MLKIRNWSALFENNRSRTVKDLAWVAIPNRHDGENYTAIVTANHGAEIFSAWVLIVQVASRCHPRGTLVRDSGKPHDVASLSLKTRAPKLWFERAIPFLLEHTDWLENDGDYQPPASKVPASRQSPDEEQKGMEGNGTEGKGKKVSVRAHPSLDEIKLHCTTHGLSESDAEWFFHKCEGNGWKNNGKPIVSWTSTISAWKIRQFLPSQKDQPKPQPVLLDIPEL